ncbi:hypothetical protein QA447_11175 [Pseudomonas sp. abacavir_1]
MMNNAALCAAISACRQRLVYIAPGLSETVAQALDELLARQDAPAVTVIIDTDPEVCRLGYGTEAGLKRLQAVAEQRHLPLRCQPGVRIGVLMCDEQMWVYAPTPLLIEAGAERADQPNGLLLSGAAALTAVARACAADGAGDEETPLPSEAEIGRQPATPQAIAWSLEDLQRQPPKPYDLARIERVYSSKLQYVELEVTGYCLASRRVQVPNDLLVGNDKTLESRLRNSFALLEGKEALVVQIPDADPATGEARVSVAGAPALVSYSEQQIEAERKSLFKDFLTPVTGYGQLISKARREAFDVRIKWFKSRIEAYKKAVDDKLTEALSKSVDDLTEALLPSVMKSPPDRLLKFALSSPASEDEIRVALKAELHEAFNTGERFFQPSVKVVFKDLTYETIQDKSFRTQVDAAFRGITMKDLFDEYDAAPELPF